MGKDSEPWVLYIQAFRRPDTSFEIGRRTRVIGLGGRL